jgi:transcriptional regulator with XRE-family HTH domain
MALYVHYEHNNGMAKTTSPLLPATSELLSQFGERLRLARLRRQLSAKQVAERAGMVPMTLRSLERGAAGVTMGAYLSVMQVLGIEQDLEQLAAADPLGRELQDSRLRLHKRAAGGLPATPTASTQQTPTLSAAKHRPQRAGRSTSPAQKPTRRAPALVKLDKPASRPRDRDWARESGFASSTALASLIEIRAPSAKKRR